MKKLQEIYNKIYGLRVYRDFEDAALDDLFMEFMLLNSEYIGLASTFINGGHIELKDIKDINGLKKKINSFNHKLSSRKDYLALKSHIYLLYDLAKELERKRREKATGHSEVTGQN